MPDIFLFVSAVLFLTIYYIKTMLSNTNHNPVSFEQRTKGPAPTPVTIVSRETEDGLISKVVPLSEADNPYSSLQESDFSLRSSLRNGTDMRPCKPLFSANGLPASSARDIIDKNHDAFLQQQQQPVTNQQTVIDNGQSTQNS